MVFGKRNGRMEGRPDDGGFGIGNVLRGIGDFVNLLSDMLAEGIDEWSETREIGGLGSKGPVRGVYGISVRLGPGKSFRVDDFGNVRREEEGPFAGGERKPLVDIFDEENGVLIVAEVPGTSPDRIHLSYESGVLSILAEGPDHRYRRDVEIRRRVRFDKREVSCKEGILKIWLPLDEPGRRQGEAGGAG